MKNIAEIESIYNDKINDVKEWCDEIFSKKFSYYFDKVIELYDKMSTCSNSQFSNSDLEWILTSLPLNLISAAETINDFRLSYEVVKLNSKQRYAEYLNEVPDFSNTAKKEYADNKSLDDKLLMMAYSSLITRAENQISYCKELIMGAKKVWDSRVKSEDVVPINPIDTSGKSDLPDYGKAYIK